jgi:hypothetical protein
VAIEVFERSTGDPTTLATQIDKLKQRFALSHVVHPAAMRSSENRWSGMT